MRGGFLKKFAPWTGLAMIALAAFGCQEKASRPPCAAGKVCLEYGNTSDPQTLDPQLGTTAVESGIIDELIDGLIDSGPDGLPVPGLATSWETSPDGLTWTLHMREALWSDATPVTADDFVYSYRRILDPKTAASYSYILYVLKNAEAVNQGKAPPESLGVKALDAHTLQLTLAHPAPYLLTLLKHYAFFAVPAHVVKRWGSAWSQPEHYVSDGPYTLESWRLGDYVRLEKNPHFYDAAHVCIDRIDFYPTTDAVSAERRVKRGELDLNRTFASRRLAWMRGPGGMAPFIHTHPFVTQVYLTLNVKGVAALKDPRVREALGLAIDRDFITRKLFGAGQVPTTAFVPVGIDNYVPQDQRPRAVWANWPLAVRQARARALMGQAGYSVSHPLKLELTLPSISGSSAAEAMQADLAAVGFQIKIAQSDAQVAFQSFEAGAFQVGVVGWIADFDDPLTFLNLMKSDTGAQNYGGYDNPAYDSLLNQADQEPDGAARARLLARAEQIMLNDNYIVPLYTNVNLNLVSPKINGWVDNDTDLHPVRYLCMKR